MLPDESVPVTVSIRGIDVRVSLQETVPGEVDSLEIEPDPVAADQRDGTVAVYWNIEDPSSEATLSYTVGLPEERSDGDELAFEGVVEGEDGHYPIDSDAVAVVVGDVFQRVLERGKVTDADIETAIDREDITAAEVNRLRRTWLQAD